jgi:hypothetical protein
MENDRKLILKISEVLHPYFKKLVGERDQGYHQAHLLSDHLVSGKLKIFNDDNCPFCGAGRIDIEDIEDPDGNFIQRCMRCGAFGPDFENEQDAKWNTRSIYGETD